MKIIMSIILSNQLLNTLTEKAKFNIHQRKKRKNKENGKKKIK